MTEPVTAAPAGSARWMLVALLAIVASALALVVWTVALLEVEVVPPDVGTCGTVLTHLVMPRAAEAAEGSSVVCAKALGGPILAAEILLWVTVGFILAAIPAIVTLAIRRNRGIRQARIAAGKEVVPLRVRLRVAPIAWVALAVSIGAIVVLYFALQGVGDSIEYAGGSRRPLDATLSPLLALLALLAIPTAIGLNIYAGTRGLGGRLTGILGGLILLSPFFAAGLQELLLPLR